MVKFYFSGALPSLCNVTGLNVFHCFAIHVFKSLPSRVSHKLESIMD